MPCSSNKWYGEEEDKILVIMTKLNVKNIRPITKSSYFNSRDNDDVAFKFNFVAQLAFLPDVTSLFVGRSKHKKCARRRRVFSPAPGLRTKGPRNQAFVLSSPAFTGHQNLHVFIPFFCPTDRPTHLHEREGDGKRNFLLGWP